MTERLLTSWYVLFPCDAYAMNIYPKENTIKSAKEFVREWLKVDRLPNNVKIWRG